MQLGFEFGITSYFDQPSNSTAVKNLYHIDVWLKTNK